MKQSTHPKVFLAVAVLLGGGSVAFAQLTTSPDHLDFGKVAIGQTSAPQTLVVTNSGTTPALFLLSAFVLIADPIFRITANGCPAAVDPFTPGTLPPGASCPVSIAFSPQSAGALKGTLTIYQSGGPGTHVPVGGVGSGGYPSFGMQYLWFRSPLGVSYTKNLTLANLGDANLTNLRFSALTKFTQTNDCPSSLAAGAQCTVHVTYVPHSYAEDDDVLYMLSDTVYAVGYEPALGLRGQSMAVVSLPGSLSFPAQIVGTESVPVGAKFAASSGTYSTVNQPLQLVGSDFKRVSGLDCPTLWMGNCRVLVTFAPTGTGSRAGVLTLTGSATSDDAPFTAPLTLSGQGVSAGPQLNLVSRLTFPAAMTVAATQPLLIQNSGTADLHFSGLSTGTGDFSVSHDCPTALAPGTYCTATLSRRAGASASYDQLTINDDAPGNPHAVALSSVDAVHVPVPPVFGPTPVGLTSTALIVPVNFNVNLNGITIVATGDFVQTNNCTSSFSTGGTCSVTVTFSPAQAGSRTGYLVFDFDYYNAPLLVPLRGIANPADSVVPQSGWWWDSQLSGIGFFLEHGGTSGNGIFLGGFLYDGFGSATWLVSTGPLTGTTYSNTWLRVTGGQTLLGTYKSPTSAPAGNVTLTFSDPTHAVMTRPDGTQINLQRFSFTSMPVPPPMAGTPQIGWWWGGLGATGTGYGIEFQGSSVFIVAYVYDASGNPAWYLATGSLTTPTSYSGTWDVYAGGPQLTSPEGTYAAHRVSSATPMNLTFTDATHGTLTMGTTVIPITRFQSF